jgi:6-phosphogluconolactonase
MMVTFPKNQKVKIVKDAEAMSTFAAETLVGHIRAMLTKQDYYSIVLSGGSTPHRLYALLADDPGWCGQIPWGRIHFFWGDERHVPPDHADSNYRMAFEALLSKVDIPPTHIHRIRSEISNAAKAAEEYETEIYRFFDIKSSKMPCFNCVLLGMGPDGHTASLFPGSPALHESRRLVMANRVDQFQSSRLTLTFPVLNNADLILLLVSGPEKADILKDVLAGDRASERYPVQQIQPSRGRLLWIVDQSAAKHLGADDLKSPLE